MIIAHRLGYISEHVMQGLTDRMGEADRLLNGLIASVRRKASATLACIGALLGVIGWNL